MKPSNIKDAAHASMRNTGGNMNSVDWNDGVEWWSGVLDWTTGEPCPQYWQGCSWLKHNMPDS